MEIKYQLSGSGKQISGLSFSCARKSGNAVPAQILTPTANYAKTLHQFHDFRHIRPPCIPPYGNTYIGGPTSSRSAVSARFPGSFLRQALMKMPNSLLHWLGRSRVGGSYFCIRSMARTGFSSLYGGSCEGHRSQVTSHRSQVTGHRS